MPWCPCPFKNEAYRPCVTIFTTSVHWAFGIPETISAPLKYAAAAAKFALRLLMAHINNLTSSHFALGLWGATKYEFEVSCSITQVSLWGFETTLWRLMTQSQPHWLLDCCCHMLEMRPMLIKTNLNFTKRNSLILYQQSNIKYFQRCGKLASWFGGKWMQMNVLHNYLNVKFFEFQNNLTVLCYKRFCPWLLPVVQGHFSRFNHPSGRSDKLSEGR